MHRFDIIFNIWQLIDSTERNHRFDLTLKWFKVFEEKKESRLQKFVTWL